MSDSLRDLRGENIAEAIAKASTAVLATPTPFRQNSKTRESNEKPDFIAVQKTKSDQQPDDGNDVIGHGREHPGAPRQCRYGLTHLFSY